MTQTFDTPMKLARFLVGMGYSYEASHAALRKDFPDANADQALYDALQNVAAEEMAIDAEIRRDVARAIGAEHNLSQTMHNKED